MKSDKYASIFWKNILPAAFKRYVNYSVLRKDTAASTEMPVAT